MNILVTGGAGFIGKYLVESLLEKENIITIFDNFSNSTKNSVNYLIKKGVKIVEGDIRNYESIHNASKEKDVVIHLAAKISVPESIKNPKDTFEVNVDGTKNVISACKKNNVKKIIISSSAAVYGESTKDVKLTESSEKNPISPYGESKLRMEEEIKKFEKDNTINCVILRFFNIYGIGQSVEYAGVITKFIEKIKKNQPLEIFGNGNQTRDFVSIEDVINAIYNSINFHKSGVYNIASGKTITIKELAQQMISISGKSIKINYLNEKKGDIMFSKADINLAKKELKYHPKIELNEGLKKILYN